MPKSLTALQSYRQALWPKTLLGRMYLCIVPLGIPFYCYVYWGPAYLHDWWVFAGATALFSTLSAVCVLAANYMTGLTIRWYPEPEQAPKRVSLNMLMQVLNVVVGTRLTLWGLDAVHFLDYTYRPERDRWAIASVGVVYVVLTGLAETAYVLSQWRNTQLEARSLEKQQVQDQLDEVKQQVNPHFLFNSLNSLSVLIGEDPQQAERFVDEMATVYRYLLQAHRTNQLPAEAGLSPLEAELEFLHSYTYLLRTRYGAGIEFCLPAGPGNSPGGLLPLTLQTLVDNAIRHNIASAETPLRIDIQALDSGSVRVRNTLQKRTVRVPIAQEGLSTLQARYRLLGRPQAIHVEADEQYFSVSVQLL